MYLGNKFTIMLCVLVILFNASPTTKIIKYMTLFSVRIFGRRCTYVFVINGSDFIQKFDQLYYTF